MFIDAPSSSADASEYVVAVDDVVVSATRVTRGPQLLSAIVLHDVSTSLRRGPFEPAARRIADNVRPGDNVRLSTFADRILISAGPIIDRNSANKAVREVSQEGGASPLWDAICASVEAIRHADGLRAIVVFSDGQATANDHGFAETLEIVARSGVIVSAVGLSDDALRVPSQMQVVGRNDGLQRLARDSGGGYAQLRAALHEPYSLIISDLNDLRDRTRLEFVPPVQDGAIHRVSVTLRGRPIHGPVSLAF